MIVDVETGGFNCATDALLEIAAVFVRFNAAGDLEPADHHRYIVKPFEGSRLDPASLQVTGIDPFHPLRPAIDEGDALRALFQEIRKELKPSGCTRAVLVGHNSFFDLQFLNAAVERTGIKRNPFHPFSSFDTATLAGVAYGQTVLSRAVDGRGLRVARRSSALGALRRRDDGATLLLGRESLSRRLRELTLYCAVAGAAAPLKIFCSSPDS